MRVALKVMTGAAAGQRIRLMSGQVAHVGRTEWADFCFPHDARMADVHFAIESAHTGCRIRDLSGAALTLLNGEAIAEAVVKSGDEIRAGETLFLVQVDGESLAGPRSTATGAASGSPAGTADEAAGGAVTAAALCTRFALEDDSRALLTPAHSPEEFLRVLRMRRQFRDAVRFYAHWLPRRESVWWGCRCFRTAGSEPLAAEDEAALKAAETWVVEPTEDHRRAAESSAEALKFGTPASWLAAAAFWSGGSIAPPGMAEVPPADHLTATGVSAALLLLASKRPVLQAPPVYEAFLTRADAVRARSDRWPES